jgi:hypothetical protein
MTRIIEEKQTFFLSFAQETCFRDDSGGNGGVGKSRMASKQLFAGHHYGMSRGSTPSVVFGKDGMARTCRGWAMSNERTND